MIIMCFFLVCSQQLLVRLYLRKHRWIRVDKLSYPEISCDLGPSIEELVRRNLLDDGTGLLYFECLIVLKKYVPK